MGLFTRDIKTMNDLFVHQLQDIYYAEKQLVKALPKMAEKATEKQLKQGFLSHLDETKTHVQRLEEVFRMHGAEVKAVNCPAIDGIIREADEVAGEVEDKSVLDAALINAAQAVEHYEIARYGSLVAWANKIQAFINEGERETRSNLNQGRDVDIVARSQLAIGKESVRRVKGLWPVLVPPHYERRKIAEKVINRVKIAPSFGPHIRSVPRSRPRVVIDCDELQLAVLRTAEVAEHKSAIV